MQRVKLILCLSLVLLVTGCANLFQKLEPPGVAVTSLDMGVSDGLNQTFIIGLTLTNPNRTDLSIVGMSYSLSLNGFELLQGVNASVPSVPAYGEAQFELTARTNLVNALRFVNNYLKKGAQSDLEYGLKANLDLGGYLGKVTVEEKGVIADVSGL